MGKTRSNLFNLIYQGKQTVSGTSDVWISLGIIPTGTQIMFGYGDYTPDGKSITFDLRGNLSGQSTGTDAATTLISRAAVKDGSTISLDYYKNGQLFTVSVLGTGVEKIWLKLTTKNSASADAYWWIYYTTI